MIKIKYNNLNPNKLHDELQQSGINVLYLGNDLGQNENIAKNIEIWLNDNEDLKLIESIIKSHDPVRYNHIAISTTDRISALEEAVLTLALGGSFDV